MFIIITYDNMQTLELIRMKTDVITTCGDVIIRLADFIHNCIQDRTFVWVWMKDKFWMLVRRISSACDLEYDTRYDDLYYEWSEEYSFADYIDAHPELENKDEYIKLKYRLCDLRDKDLIPNVI